MNELLPGKYIFLMTDASFRWSGYALMIEDNPDQKIQSKRKTCDPGVFGSELLSPVQLELSIYSKEFLGIYMAISELAHILKEVAKTTIVLTDNKSFIRFFQMKTILPALWNSSDNALQFNFKTAKIAGSVNTLAEFTSRPELKVSQKVRLKIREDTQTTPLEVTTSTLDVADEEQLPLTQVDTRNESKEQICDRKE